MTDNPPRFGVVLPLTFAAEPKRARAFCREAEERGFDAIWVNDLPTGAEPFELAAFAASATERVTLGIAVYIVTLHHPTEVARSVATLDRLSGGRFVLGVGVGGDRPPDHAIHGRDPRERGGRMDEALPLLRRLWSGEEVEHRGRFFKASGRLGVTPVQDPLPVFIGSRGGRGLAANAYRRVVGQAQGWLPYVMTPESYAERSAAIDAEAERASKPPGTFRRLLLEFVNVNESEEAALRAAAEQQARGYGNASLERVRRYTLAGTPEGCAERLRRFRAAGAEEFIFNWSCPADEIELQMRRLAEDVIPAVAP